MASDNNVSDVEMVNPVDNGSLSANNVDLEVLLETPPVKRSKSNEEKSAVVPNFSKLRSETYKLYKWDKDGLWKCRLCGLKYRHCKAGGSASLKNHLDTHQKQINEAGGILTLAEKLDDAENKGYSISKHVNRRPRTPPREVKVITAEGYKELLVKLFATTSLPCWMIKEQSFAEYGKYLSSDNPNCKNPSPTTLAKWIDEEFVKREKELIQILQSNPGKISFILDCWTSSTQKPFQGVIACWINQNWSLCHTPIDLTLLQGSHTGHNLSESFSGVLEKYGLWKQLLAITSDNASNMDTFFKEFQKRAKNSLIDFDSNQFRVRCMAHIINLACQAVVKAVVGKPALDSLDSDNSDADDTTESEADAGLKAGLTFLDKLRHATRTIRASPQRREYFEEQCKTYNVKHKELLTDCPTRWNSTLVMLKRLVELRDPFLSTCEFVGNLNRLNLHIDDEIWQKIDQTIKLLEPFEKATLKLSQAHSPTISDVSSIFQYLFAHLEVYIEETDKKIEKTRSRSSVFYPEWLKLAAKDGWNKLVKYYGTCDNTVNIVSTVMDPRYKLKWFQSSWRAEYFNAARQKTVSMWNKYKRLGSDETGKLNQDATVAEMDEIASTVAEKLRSHYKPDDELHRYLNEPLVSMSVGVEGALQWWRTHAVSYPNLSKMAMDFLAVSATGVPVERLFSSGPDICKQKQQSMKADTIRKRILLKQWFRKSDQMDFVLDIINSAAINMIDKDLDEDQSQ